MTRETSEKGETSAKRFLQVLASRARRAFPASRFTSSKAARFAREKIPVQLLEPCPLDMGIDLGGRNVGVAEHRLDGPQICAMIQQMGREGMPQHVR